MSLAITPYLPGWLATLPGPAPARTRRSHDALLAASSDETLMTRWQRGDAAAFEQLYRRYRERLHRYLLRLAPSAAEAEELFQEVWMALIRQRDRYVARERFASWLFAIAHRRAADRWRALHRHVPDWRTGAPQDSEQPLAGVSGEQAPEHQLDEQARGAALLAAIEQLPLLQREAFLLRAEAGLSVDDIAAVTQVSRETAKSRLRYAYARLRQQMEPWR